MKLAICFATAQAGLVNFEQCNEQIGEQALEIN